MKPEELKSRSRGISRDMSPEAISARFDILVDLHDTARILAAAKLAGKRHKPSPSKRRGR
jgi:hypothetical protein